MNEKQMDRLDSEAREQRAASELAPSEIAGPVGSLCTGDLLAPFGLRLHDRADGCKGHFCIERDAKSLGYVEFWNEEAGKWCAFGTVYDSEDEALGRAWRLCANTELTGANRTEN